MLATAVQDPIFWSLRLETKLHICHSVLSWWNSWLHLEDPFCSCRKFLLVHFVWIGIKLLIVGVDSFFFLWYDAKSSHVWISWKQISYLDLYDIHLQHQCSTPSLLGWWIWFGSNRNSSCYSVYSLFVFTLKFLRGTWLTLLCISYNTLLFVDTSLLLSRICIMDW